VEENVPGVLLKSDCFSGESCFHIWHSLVRGLQLITI
jgi:hypothetical protein